MPCLATLVPRTLRHRGFRLLLCGRSAGDLGSEMLPVAMVGLVLVEHGPLLLGLVLGVRGAAGSLFALLTGALLTRVRKSTALVGVLCFPLTLLGLALTVPVAVLLASYTATGVGFMVFGVYWYTALQKAVPQDRLSVVISIDQVGSFGLEPVGYAVAGVLAETVGARTVLFWAAAVGLVTSLLPLLVPGVSRPADRDSDQDGGPGSGQRSSD